MMKRSPCADPNQAALLRTGPHAELSLRTLRSCPECMGGCHTHDPRGARSPCEEREGWRRVHLFNRCLIPAQLATMDLHRASMLTGSSLSSAWRWLQTAPELEPMWVKGDHLKRDPRVILAALCHDLTTSRGLTARYVSLHDLADAIVAHYKTGLVQSLELRYVAKVDVLALAGLDGGMRAREAEALRWLASKRPGPVVFGSTRTSLELGTEVGRLLVPHAGTTVLAWMAKARPMGWA